MKLRMLAAVTAVALSAALTGVALARNPHCAGGIQYVVQGLRDKEKGNMEDYTREMNKAVDQLSACAGEDEADFEAQGYLGWAYAELDSAGPAGLWFAKSLAAATVKGDKKKIEIIQANRDHYWSMRYNDGIAAIGSAQSAYPDFAKEPGDDEKEMKDVARKSYETAVLKLTQAKLLRPGHPQTVRNLATAYALMADFDHSEIVLRNGLVDSPGDSGLVDALKSVRANKANAFVAANKFDEAIAYYSELVKQEPNSVDLFTGLANSYFSRATGKPEAARRPDFRAAADAYSRAYQLRDTDGNLAFNAALAYQNAGELALAEAQWRTVLVKNPKDSDALYSLGLVLTDAHKYDEARTVLMEAIGIKPEDKLYYLKLATVFSKQNNSPKMTEMMFVYLAMHNGTAAADAAATAKTAKAGSAAANTLTALGAPDKVLAWSDNTAGALQTWMYTSRKLAFTFNSAGLLIQKSDWTFGKK